MHGTQYHEWGTQRSSAYPHFGSQSYATGHPYHYHTDYPRSTTYQTSYERGGFDGAGVLVSLVIAALAVVATYYALTKGLELYDFAELTNKTKDFFAAGFFLYLAFSASCVAVGNVVMAYFRGIGACKQRSDSRDCNIDMGTQIAASIGFPILCVPAALWFGVKLGLFAKR